MEASIIDNLVTGLEMARIIGVSRVTLKKWRDNGIVPYYMVGMKKKYHPEEVKKAIVLKNQRSSTN